MWDDVMYTVSRNLATCGIVVGSFKATATIMVWLTGETVIFFR